MFVAMNSEALSMIVRGLRLGIAVSRYVLSRHTFEGGAPCGG
jgi:hypothetical protein